MSFNETICIDIERLLGRQLTTEEFEMSTDDLLNLHELLLDKEKEDEEMEEKMKDREEDERWIK